MLSKLLSYDFPFIHPQPLTFSSLKPDKIANLKGNTILLQITSNEFLLVVSALPSFLCAGLPVALIFLLMECIWPLEGKTEAFWCCNSQKRWECCKYVLCAIPQQYKCLCTIDTRWQHRIPSRQLSEIWYQCFLVRSLRYVSCGWCLFMETAISKMAMRLKITELE